MTDLVQKWDTKRIVALASDGTVVSIDGSIIDLDEEDVRPIDLVLWAAGQEGWEVVSVNNLKFDRIDAMQYTLKKPVESDK